MCFQTSAPSFDLSQHSLERLGENDSLAFNPTLLRKHVGKMQLAGLIPPPCTFLEVVDKPFLDPDPSFIPAFKNGTYCCVRADGWWLYSSFYAWTLRDGDLKSSKKLLASWALFYVGTPFPSPLDNGPVEETKGLQHSGVLGDHSNQVMSTCSMESLLRK